MEQASIPHAGAARQRARAPEQTRLPIREAIKKSAAELAIIASCAVAIVAGAVSGSKTPDHSTAAPEPAVPTRPLIPDIESPDYAPIASLNQVRHGTRHVIATSNRNVGVFGHAEDIIKPDKDHRKAFRSNFKVLNSGVTPPAPKEAIHIRDRRHTFAGEYRSNPDLYPFIIYNTTSQPVDIEFINYALRATRYWLNKNENQELDISGHTLARVEPITVPHAMIMANEIPGHTVVNGITFKGYGRGTTSFIRNNGAGTEPFSRSAIATEICQSLVNIKDEKTVAGEGPEEQALKNFVATFNKPAAHNLDLASQESGCNGLGSFVTAVYNQGSEGLHDLPQSQGVNTIFKDTPLLKGISVEAPYIDYSLYRPEAAKFVWLAKHITGPEFLEVIAQKGAHTPTVDYYRHHSVLH